MSGVFEDIGKRGGGLLLVADHASNFIPPEMNGLGLSGEVLEQHIAYDIGTASLARALCERLNARAILAGFSRLIIDPNRTPDQEGLIPEVSDATPIPANIELGEGDRAHRIERFYTPYHAAIAQEIAAAPRPLKILSLHSFTPRMNGFSRPWHAGVLFNKDDRLALRMARALEGHGLVVGRNEPYPGSIFNHTMDHHAEAAGIPYVTLEIRQDLLGDEDGISHWCDIVSTVLPPLLEIEYE